MENQQIFYESLRIIENLYSSRIFPPTYPERFYFSLENLERNHVSKIDVLNRQDKINGTKTEKKFYEQIVAMIKEDEANKRKYFLIQVDGIKDCFKSHQRPGVQEKTCDFILFYDKSIFLIDCKHDPDACDSLNHGIEQCKNTEKVFQNIEIHYVKNFVNLKFNKIVYGFKLDDKNNRTKEPWSQKVYECEFNDFKSKLQNQSAVEFQMNDASEANNIELLKAYLVDLYRRLNFKSVDQQNEHTYELLKSSAVVFNPNDYKLNYVILNGPAGSGKTILLQEKIARTINYMMKKNEGSNKLSLTLIYSCLEEKFRGFISSCIKRIWEDRARKFLAKPQNKDTKIRIEVPKFYVYGKTISHEIKSMQHFFTKDTKAYLHMNVESSFVLLKNNMNNSDCCDILLDGFPEYYFELFQIMEKLDFKDIRNKFFLFYENLFYNVHILITCIKHCFLLAVYKNRDSKNFLSLKDKYRKLKKSERNYKLTARSSSDQTSASNQKQAANYKEFNEFILQQIAKLTKDQQNSLQDLLDYYCLSDKVDVLKEYQEKLVSHEKLDNNDVKWLVLEKLNQKLTTSIKINNLSPSIWNYETQEKFNDTFETNIDGFDTQTICRELFKNAILLSFRFFLSHLHNIKQMRIEFDELNIFVDDSMGCFNQINRHSKTTIYPEHEDKLRNFWITMDTHQFPEIIRNDTQMIPGFEKNFQIIQLNTVYRCTGEIFRIYRLFYDEYERSMRRGLYDQSENMQIFKCFCCFKKQAQEMDDSKIKLNISFIQFYQRINSISQYNCRLLLGGIFQETPFINIDDFKTTLKQKLDDYLSLKEILSNENKLICIFVDRNNNLLEYFKEKSSQEEEIIKKTQLLGSSIVKFIEQDILKDDNYGSVNLVDSYDNNSSLVRNYSQEYPIVIHVFPGVFGYVINKKITQVSMFFPQQEDESVRFDAYFGVSRATSVLEILYSKCPGC